jgi:hypothetical protein
MVIYKEIEKKGERREKEEMKFWKKRNVYYLFTKTGDTLYFFLVLLIFGTSFTILLFGLFAI